MKPFWPILAVLAVGSVLRAADRWKMVDDGFRMVIPWDWEKRPARGIDSHVGEYRGKKAYIEFDEVCGLGYTAAKANAFIAQLRKKEADRSLLKADEDVWRIDGRLAHVTIGSVDRQIYGVREFANVAHMFVPYEGDDCYLEVIVFFDSKKERDDAVRILRSIKWPKKPKF
jgi:hypothetical protein